MADVSAGRWIAPAVWAAAADPGLPEGVIALQDREGRWWRYLLAEFPDERG